MEEWRKRKEEILIQNIDDLIKYLEKIKNSIIYKRREFKISPEKVLEYAKFIEHDLVVLNEE